MSSLIQLNTIMSQESLSSTRMVPVNSNACQAISEQCRISNAPVGILWDIENCPVPSDVRAEDVAGNIRMALRIHPVIKGAVTMFSAYGDFNAFPRRLREGCQRTGVKLIDIPNGRKDAADKAILVDMFLFALDNPPPSSILLISGDVDFAPALHILGQRRYTVILVIPDKVGVSSALSSAGRFVWDWPSVARGEGVVPRRGFVHNGPEYMMGCHLVENADCRNEEEAIVYAGVSQSGYSTRDNISEMYCLNSSFASREPSRGFLSMTEAGGSNFTGLPSVLSLRSRSLPSGPCEVPLIDQSQGQDDIMWVRPGDIQGLKGQLVRLLEMSGGSLPLVRVPAEYLKNYGRPLYVAEYGAPKLVNLVKKMGGTFSMDGWGHNKILYLGNSGYRHEKPSLWTCGFPRKGRKEKVTIEDNVGFGPCPNMGSSSDDFSDDEKAGLVEDGEMDATLHAAYDYSGHLNNLKQEIQELLVCYSCRVLLSSFEALYEQRYKKSLEYQSYGVEGLEELIEKAGDVVVLHEEPEGKRKFLVSSSMSG